MTKGEALCLKRQAELLGANRTSFYHGPKKPSEESVLREEREELLKHLLDKCHTKHPWMGSRKLCLKLRQDDGVAGVGRDLVRRLMRDMGITPVYPKPNLSKPGKGHAKFPYLLRGKRIWLPNQVWAVDITYISLGRTHMYMTAIIDWHSRFIVGWGISATLEATPVLEALEAAMERHGTPSIINSDQGSQFTSAAYVRLLKEKGIRQSMDGKGRWVDNVVIERWFRSLKTECIYINEYQSPKELRRGIDQYVREYNHERPHQRLGGMRPAQVHAGTFGERSEHDAA